MTQAAIATEHLTKFYGARTGIVDLNLEVAAGEIFGFIGPNGAGKTTTIRILLDFIRPTSGRAWVLGFDTRRENVRMRREIGYLPGEFSLDPRMTGRELLWRFARLRQMDNLGVATALASRFEVDLDVPMGRLSRGNRQKIGLLQALFHRPKLLILDEPTTGLDPLVQEAVLATLRESQDEGRTVFLSSHILSEVQKICDRVGIVKEGRLVAVETTESLREKQRRRVTLVFGQPVKAADFAQISGATQIEIEENTVRLCLDDGIDSVVKVAAQYTVVDLKVERPTLDEIFLQYYESGS